MKTAGKGEFSSMSTADLTGYIRQEILRNHSKEQKDLLVNWIGTDDDRLRAFLEVYFCGDPVIGQRAAYVMGWLGKEHQQILQEYYPRMIEELDNKKLHPARARNVLRLFETVDIPADIRMELLDHCFAFLHDPKLPDAIRAFAITVLGRIVEPYPELQQEIGMVLREHMPESRPSFKVRARDFLKKFDL